MIPRIWQSIVWTTAARCWVRGTVEDGYYTVITKTAGTYALVEKGSTITDAQENTANIPRPATTPTWRCLLCWPAAAGMMGVTLVTRKRKSNEALNKGETI